MRHLLALILVFVFAFSAYKIAEPTLVQPNHDWIVTKSSSPKLIVERFVEKSGSVTELQNITNDFRDTVPATSSVVVADIDSSLVVGYGVDTQFTSASLYKLFIAYLVLEDADTGVRSLSDPSHGRNVGECLRLMIVVSDNDCAVALSKTIGHQNVDNRLAAKGYEHTSLNNYDSQGRIAGDKLTTCGDVTRLLKKLHDGELLSEKSSRSFLDLLSAQEINDRLPSPIPPGVEFWHKTGSLLDVAHDAGFIVRGEKTYVYAVMTGEWKENAFTSSPPYFHQLYSDIIGSESFSR